MTSKSFCYWLMGSLELNENEELNEKQTQIVKNHLNMCFAHVAHLPEQEDIRHTIPSGVDPASLVKVNC